MPSRADGEGPRKPSRSAVLQNEYRAWLERSLSVLRRIGMTSVERPCLGRLEEQAGDGEIKEQGQEIRQRQSERTSRNFRIEPQGVQGRRNAQPEKTRHDDLTQDARAEPEPGNRRQQLREIPADEFADRLIEMWGRSFHRLCVKTCILC